jgi:peptide/nickel transport system substrate-binding protein
VSTAGNERRQLAFEIIQAFLGQIGIKVNADFSPAAVQFGERGPKGDYDLFNQGAVFNDPVPFGPYFRCDGNLNKSGYCNRQLDTLMDQITVTADAAKHAALLNEMDRIIADDLPLFPVYGLPRMAVYNAARVGGFDVSQNTDAGGGGGGMYWNWNAEQIYRVH